MKFWSFFLLINVVVGDYIRGYNLFGLETDLRAIDCSWAHEPEYYISQLHEQGFNHIRLPFSIQYVEEGNLEQMDKVFEIVSKYQPCNITIDAHRVYTSHQGPDPTEGGMSLTRYTGVINTLLERYQHYPFLFGVDVFNEYQGVDVNFWNSELKAITGKIEERFPNRFYYFCGGGRWGGSLAGIDIEDVEYHDRVKYTIHKYIFSGNSEPNDWDYSFGTHLNKTSVGEWGFFSEKPNEVKWAKEFISWLKKNGIRDNFFWTTVSNSGDTGGIFKNCETLDLEKMKIIKDLWDGPVIRRLRY